MIEHIDTCFDFRTDTPPGKDPDALSPTLRRYHKQLWSKSLPNGIAFTLTDNNPGHYLYHSSEVGEFSLASDTVIPFFSRKKKIAHIIKQISKDDLKISSTISYSIGGMMLFPANRINGKMTINGARGFHPRIADRFDLTVECIRRHYLNKPSPLSETLERYSDFFTLFNSFKEYINFFLLQDIVNSECSEVQFFTPFIDFNRSPLPESVEQYLDYKHLAIAFIKARNNRIKALN